MTESMTELVKPRKSRRRQLAQRLALVLASGLLTLLALEVAYRVKLFATLGHTPLGASRSFMAHQHVPVEFDREFGFRYRPNQTFVGVRIVDRKPVLFYRRTFDEFGNPRCRPACKDPELTLAVFGDSFTAQADDETLWTEVVEAELSRQISKRIRVVNYGRDAYGILQMFDLAASRATQDQPDLVVFAFISDDLNRDRSWTIRSDRNAEQRVFSTDSPDQSEHSTGNSRIPNGVYDAGITEQWARAIVRTQTMDDELLLSLNERYQRLLDSNPLPIDYWSLGRSFLFHRLRNRDPFFGIPGVSANPRFQADDFDGDARFMAAVKTLRSLDCPITLIHLPQFEELEAGRYLLTAQQQSLLESLKVHVGVDPINLLDRRPTKDLGSLFLLPHDRHPSAAGHRYYGESISVILGERELLATKSKREM
ncbi:MAG: SGNH/GDSL hydrolase family protein [Planctomycetota bacterium]|nr:SGNH/GDSL hydrolase family protein [Planctomycetota bacterium]